jgi:uncharacterized protein YbjQ (UPF0145 family)
MKDRTMCQCNACANINTLGMKTVEQCGEFLKSEVGEMKKMTFSNYNGAISRMISSAEAGAANLSAD